jgi:hypothetical protein
MRAALLIALSLAGCAVADDRYARLKPYIGRTMADFSRDTGLLPSDKFDTAKGRVFVVNGPVMVVAVSPGIAVAGGCKMQVETVADNPSGLADSWRIVRIDATGPC